MGPLGVLQRKTHECLHTIRDKMNVQRGLYNAKLALTVSTKAIVYGMFTWQIMAPGEREEAAALVLPHLMLHDILMK